MEENMITVSFKPIRHATKTYNGETDCTGK